MEIELHYLCIMNVKGKVAFYTLGCKLNFAETSTIGRQFETAGYQRVAFEDAADIYVINTCSVTDHADKKNRNIIRSALRKNPDAYIIVVGCYAQLQPEEIAAIDGVDLVLGAAEKFNVHQYIGDLSKQSGPGTIHSCAIEETDFYTGAYSMGDRTRAFLKVQDGCDYKCTYCTIPQARGISRSARLEQVVDQAQKLVQEGAVELVLTGVNIGDYGKGEFGNKKHEHTFLELVQALDRVPGVSRVRISSIEPNLLRDELIAFTSESERFVPHFHIPLQSGSDEILGLMKRRYRTDLYKKRIDAIYAGMPDAAIGIDVIVGFPGETDELFMETYQFLNELDFTYLHVFTFSERPGTEAWDMPGRVSPAVRQKRNKMLRILSAKKKLAFYERFVGTTRPVLFELENKDGWMYGYTDNYIRVRIPYDAAWGNRELPVFLERLNAQGDVDGSLVTENLRLPAQT